MKPVLPTRFRAGPFDMAKATVRRKWAQGAAYDGTHGDAKHKWYCKAKPPPGTSKCPKTMTAKEALDLVKDGLNKGLFKRDPRRPDAWPLRVYAFRKTEKGAKAWFEAKRTFVDKGEYHGYPIEEKAVPAEILNRA